MFRLHLCLYPTNMISRTVRDHVSHPVKNTYDRNSVYFNRNILTQQEGRRKILGRIVARITSRAANAAVLTNQ